MPVGRWVAGCAAVVVMGASTAQAFTLETAVTDGCHERITLKAIARASWPGNASAPGVTHDDEVLANNLPFSVPRGSDRWSMALVVGVRDNDLEGHAFSDLPELAAVHSGDDQASHCLRSADQDFDQGDADALKACREFIHHEIDLAVGTGDLPELSATEDVMVSLRFQRQAVPLSRYAFHMGRAMHALQDSYAHSFRESSSEEVVSVLNYVEAIFAPKFDVKRDGAAHLGTLDQCQGSDFALRRADEAAAASTALLEAAALSLTQTERHQKIDAVLDGSLRYLAGCDSENEWCGALDGTGMVSPAEQPKGCSVAPSGSLLMLGALWLRSRRRRASARW